MVLVAITGATGVQIAVKLLEVLKEMNISTELIISKAAKVVIEKEMDIKETYDGIKLERQSSHSDRRFLRYRKNDM